MSKDRVMDFDPTIAYRDWRRTVSVGTSMQDVDCIEYDANDSPVVLLELTHARYRFPDAWKTKTRERIETRSRKAKRMRMLAIRLRIPAYVVGFMLDVSAFCVYDMLQGTEWVTYTPLEYERWLGHFTGAAYGRHQEFDEDVPF